MKSIRDRDDDGPTDEHRSRALASALAARPQLWLEHVPPFNQPSPLGGLLGALAWSSMLFLTGAVIMTGAGQGALFGGTLAAYLGPMGVALVAFSIHWGWNRIPRALEEVAACFRDEEGVRGLAESALATMPRTRMTLSAGSLFGLLIVGGGIYVMLNPDSAIAAVPLRIYGAAWFAADARLAKLIVLVLYALPVALLVVTGASLIAQNTVVVWQLSHRRLRLVWSHLLPRLRALVAFYTVVGAAWSAGIILVLALYRSGLDVLIGTFVALTSLLGLTIVLLPHVMLHEALLRAERELGDIIQSQSAEALVAERDAAKRIAIYRTASEPLKLPTWPYEIRGYITLVLGQLAPPVYAFLTRTLQPS